MDTGVDVSVFYSPAGGQLDYSIRNTLLPRLISGELRLPDVLVSTSLEC